MRPAHWLKGNKGTPFPQAAIWLDTETDPVELADGTTEHRLRFGWACYQRTRDGGLWTAPEWFRFQTPAEAWEWIASKARPRTRLYVYAHNWSFDGPVLDVFGQLVSAGWRMTRAIIEGPPVILAFRRDRSTVELLDTLNFWPVRLAEIGEAIGLPKMRPPSKRASVAAWDTYCRNDVEIIRRATHEWWTFLQSHELGGYAKTVAGQAFRAYRHRFMGHQILIDDDTSALVLAREALFGGRTEAYRIGRVRSPCDLWDVNSMYPAVMAQHDYPTILRLHARDVERAEWERWIPAWACIARVDVETETPRYPYRMDGRLVFPVGRFQTTLSTPELRAALAAGELVWCHEIALYDSAPIFRGYVQELHGLRREAIERGDSMRSWQVKTLLNGLYGKFAQSGRVWREVADAPAGQMAAWREVDADTAEVHDYRAFAGRLQERSVEPESHDSAPAIAAHVTAYGRQLLWDVIRLAGPKHVLYCDTDSVWVYESASKRLREWCHPTALGCLKHVERVDWLTIHGAKDYATPARVVCKGVRERATWIEPATIRQEEWSGLAGLVELGRADAPRTSMRTMHLLRRYEKGTICRDGSIAPLRLAEW